MAVKGEFSTGSIGAVDADGRMLATVSMTIVHLSSLVISNRPLCSVAVPVFPATVEEAGLMGMDGFLLGADGSVLQGADI